MTTNYIVRDFSHADIDSWCIMWRDYLKFYQTDLTQEVTMHTVNKLLSNDENIGCLVVCDVQNNPIGFLTYIIHFNTWEINPVCYLEDLFVDDNYRKTGVAKLLLNRLKEIGISKNWSRIYWLTKPNNTVARIFYDKIAKSEDWARYILPLNNG